MLHPPLVHFAIVLPLVTSVFALWYLFKREKIFANITIVLMFFSFLAMIGAWYSGANAATEIYEYLSEAGQHELREHKELGLYLMFALFALSFLFSVAYKLGKFSLQMLLVLAWLGVNGVVLKQGKDGGEIVYEHGQPFQTQFILETLRDVVQENKELESAKEKLEAFEESVEEIQSISKDIDEIYEDK